MVFQMIYKGPAIRFRVKRPAKSMHDKPLLMLFRWNLPKLFNTKTIRLRLTRSAQIKSLKELFAERPSTSFCKNNVMRQNLNARFIRIFLASFSIKTSWCRFHPNHLTSIVIQRLTNRESRINLNP